MRYISLFTHEGPSAAPTEQEIATMGKLIEDGMKAGWLIVTEGVSGSSPGTRVQAKGGEISVTDGPFAEAKEIIGGYAILRVESREEAVTLSKNFLAAVGGNGTCELHQLHEMPAGGRS
ncbi:MAG TPA: YciI family protein [Polyangia bacterium]|jgi:hypothetical protein